MSRVHNLVQDSERWNGFEFRDGDIVISTPAKCGTTWTQMITALLIFDTVDLPAPLARLSPWLDMMTRPEAEVKAELAAQTHRRFIKSHLPLSALPWDERVTYLSVGRDPRDVAISWANHMANVDMGNFLQERIDAVGLDDLAGAAPPDPGPSDPVEALWFWIETDTPDDVFGFRGLVQHLHSFWERRDQSNVVLLHYGDLQRDLVGQMAYLAERLGIERTRERLEELAPAASFEQMKAAADRVAPNSDQTFWKSTSDFFRSGKNGQWREFIDDDELPRYEQRVASLTKPDFADWLHNGSLS